LEKKKHATKIVAQRTENKNSSAIFTPRQQRAEVG